MSRRPEVIPAILAKSKSEFMAKYRKVSGRFRIVQIDVMNASFVPYRSWADPATVAKLKDSFELHLMVNNPLAVMKKWAAVKNIKRVLVHIETLKTTDAVCAILEYAYSLGWEVGIAVNPATKLDRLRFFIEDIDELLIMGVRPGKSGQKFIPGVLNKIRQAAHAWDLPIAVDGGVNEFTRQEIIKAGATRLVSGSMIYGTTRKK